MKRLTLVLLLLSAPAARAVDFTPIGGGFSSSQIDTSAELAAIVGDETGSGSLVFADSPTLNSPRLGADGTVTVPAIGRGSTGLYFSGLNGQLYFAVGGTYYGGIYSSAWKVPQNYAVGWEGGSAGSAVDVSLYRGGADILELRRLANAQNVRIFNTDNGANDEYLQVGFTANVARLETAQTGTGTQRNLLFAAPTITISGDASVAGNLAQTAGANRQVTTNRSAVTDYCRFMFQTGGTEMWAFGQRGDNGGSGVNNTLSLAGNAGDSYPVVLNVIPGGANYTVEVGAAHKLKASGKLSHGTAGALTIATGVVTATKGYHTVDTEAAAATDDLDTISGGAEGDRVILRAADAARTVVCKDGAGNLRLAGDCTLDNSEDTIELIHDGTNWLEVCRSNNGA